MVFVKRRILALWSTAAAYINVALGVWIYSLESILTWNQTWSLVVTSGIRDDKKRSYHASVCICRSLVFSSNFQL